MCDRRTEGRKDRVHFHPQRYRGVAAVAYRLREEQLSSEDRPQGKINPAVFLRAETPGLQPAERSRNDPVQRNKEARTRTASSPDGLTSRRVQSHSHNRPLTNALFLFKKTPIYSASLLVNAKCRKD